MTSTVSSSTAVTGRKVALVTGAARRIGRTIALRLAEDGYDIAIHCHSAVAESQELAAQFLDRGTTAIILMADLADPAAVDSLIPEVEGALGPVTLLVNNASTFLEDQVTSLDVAQWNRQFSVNLRAPSVLAGAMANRLPPGAEGAIINIIDQRVWRPTPQYYSYTLSKSALLTATKTMAQALAPRIRVNAVGPGPTFANLHDGEERFQMEAAGTLLGHAVEPQEIADAVSWLAGARSVTGQMVAVDSGQHLTWKTVDIVS